MNTLDFTSTNGAAPTPVKGKGGKQLGNAVTMLAPLALALVAWSVTSSIWTTLGTLIVTTLLAVAVLYRNNMASIQYAVTLDTAQGKRELQLTQQQVMQLTQARIRLRSGEECWVVQGQERLRVSEIMDMNVRVLPALQMEQA